MLNSEFLNEQAALFADRLRREAGSDVQAASAAGASTWPPAARRTGRRSSAACN